MRGVLLDIDGTTLLGTQALPGAAQLVRYLRQSGVGLVWVTNNTSLSRDGWRARLAAAGLEPRPEEIYTAGDATIDHLLALDPVPRVHLVGTPELARDFEAAGIVLVDDAPDALVLGYDVGLTYEKLRRAALLLQDGVPFYATHPDPTCPSPEGPVPDVGSFLALFERACGRRAKVLGKPEPTLVAGALGRLGVEPPDAVMVGDRLSTDVRMANRAGVRSFLVLTGITRRGDLEAAADKPTEVFPSLVEVHARLCEEAGA